MTNEPTTSPDGADASWIAPRTRRVALLAVVLGIAVQIQFAVIWCLGGYMLPHLGDDGIVFGHHTALRRTPGRESAILGVSESQHCVVSADEERGLVARMISGDQECRIVVREERGAPVITLRRAGGEIRIGFDENDQPVIRGMVNGAVVWMIDAEHAPR